MIGPVLVALMLAAPQSDGAPPVGNPDNVTSGKVVPAGRFSTPDLHHPRGCGWCHGIHGDGGFGPDLAGGRGLSWEQFRRAVRDPWGFMPVYSESQLPEQALADIFAYINTLPVATAPGPRYWRAAPPTAPAGQRLAMNVIGCGQCHEPEQKFPRTWLGEVAKDVTFEYFADLIYNHSTKFPRGSMPDFSRERIPEVMLREVYDWMKGIGWRASIGASFAVGQRGGDRTTYTLTATNRGQAGKGLTAEGITVFVRIPSGTTVAGATGDGYVGTMRLAQLGLEPALQYAPHSVDDSGHVERPVPDLSRDVAVWRVKQLGPAEKLTLTLTLQGPLNEEVIEGFEGSTIHWANPGRRPAGSPPVMVYRDLRIPDNGDHERIAPPKMP